MSYAKIKINHAALRRLDRAAVRALELTAEEVHRDVVNALVIPYDTSHLQNDATFVDYSGAPYGHVEIVSSTPYARRLYYNPELQTVSEHTVKEHTVKAYTRKDGTHVKEHTVREHTVKAHTTGKMKFSHEENTNAKDHWFEDWADGGKKSDFAQKKFAEFFKQEAGL